jgi:tetrathionate reductase subunit B
MLTQAALPPPRHHRDSCAAGSDGIVGCRICVEACPYGALRPRTSAGGTTIEVDAASCARCGACTAVCPTSSLERSFIADDELRALALAVVDAGQPLALIGDHHPEVVASLTAAGWGVVEVPSVLIVESTLLVAGLLGGAPAIAVLGCHDCHHDALHLVTDAARTAMALMGRPGSTLVADLADYGTGSALAGLLAATREAGRPAAPMPVHLGSTPATMGHRRQLAELLTDRDLASAELLPGFGRVDVVDDACTLCGACARACPTGALDLTDGRLTTRDVDCVECGMCTAACPEGAVEVVTAATSDLLVRRELVADDVVPCVVCGEPHLPARLLDRARRVVAASDRPPTHASRQLDRCPSCRSVASDGLRSIDDGRPVPIGVPQIDRRSFLTGAAASVAGALGMIAMGADVASATATTAQDEAAGTAGRLGMVIDIGRCIGCHACTAACKSENHVPLDVNRDWVEEYVQGEYPNAKPVFVPKLCNHCTDPGCLRACPTGAIFKRSDGIVDLDHSMCIGCRACNQACPYGATFVDPIRHTADKCNLCSHRVDEGLRPACVDVCPSQCRVFGDLDDPDSAPSRLMAEHATTVLRPELGLGPNVHYVGLPTDPGEPTTATTVGHGGP